MKNYTLMNTPENEMNQEDAGTKVEVIYLGIDVHALRHVVVRQMDGGTPQPAQGFSPAKFVPWLRKQRSQARRVVACYEAGPCGFGLCRLLRSLNVECLVVRPRCWDQYGQKVKTDGRDARALCEVLERFDRGNKNALAVVRVPTEQEERLRTVARQREALTRARMRLEAQGRGVALYHGHQLKGRWWGQRIWSALVPRLPEWLVPLLAPLQRVILNLHLEAEALSSQLETAAEARAAHRPKGLGALSCELVQREVVDWGRFSNRRQVASYTGLCPSEQSSGGSRKQGPINKHGNPRLRRVLVEAAWRLVRWQPGWIRFQKIQLQWRSASIGRRKQLIAALARQLAIDLWRLATGRTTLDNLGLAHA
jgi:transposase